MKHSRFVHDIFPAKSLICKASAGSTLTDDCNYNQGMLMAYGRVYIVKDLQLDAVKVGVNRTMSNIGAGLGEVTPELQGKITITGAANFSENGTGGRPFIISAQITGTCDRGTGMSIGRTGTLAPGTDWDNSYVDLATTVTATNTMTGTITVLGSYLKVSNATGLGAITKLELRGSAGFPAGLKLNGVSPFMPNMDMIVGANGIVTLNAQALTVKTLTVNGTAKANGTYTAAQLAATDPTIFSASDTGSIIVSGGGPVPTPTPRVNPVQGFTYYH